MVDMRLSALIMIAPGCPTSSWFLIFRWVLDATTTLLSPVSFRRRRFATRSENFGDIAYEVLGSDRIKIKIILSIIQHIDKFSWVTRWL